MLQQGIKSMANNTLFHYHGVHALVDGQYGSTGKGALAAWLAKQAYEQDVHFSWDVTNAGPNSGHTFYAEDGTKHVLKQLPTFAVAAYVNGWGYTSVHLSAGAIIDPKVLCDEARKYPGLDIVVHPMATVVDQEDKAAEHSGSVAAVAGTRSGAGAALARKVLRDPNVVFRELFAEQHFPPNVRIGALELDPWGGRIMLEVSQGFSLGLNSGFYPKVTSRECTVMQGLADARLPPRSVTKTYLSMRTFPIRVGNVDGHDSGGHYVDQAETSWEAIGQAPELTTVTQRVRRVFTFSVQQAEAAIQANDPDFVFCNFLNYLTEDGQRDMIETMDHLRGNAARAFDVIEGYGATTKDIKW
jgi:adenylosuccinate synthase